MYYINTYHGIIYMYVCITLYLVKKKYIKHILYSMNHT